MLRLHLLSARRARQLSRRRQELRRSDSPGEEKRENGGTRAERGRTALARPKVAPETREDHRGTGRSAHDRHDGLAAEEREAERRGRESDLAPCTAAA